MTSVAGGAEHSVVATSDGHVSEGTTGQHMGLFWGWGGGWGCMGGGGGDRSENSNSFMLLKFTLVADLWFYTHTTCAVVRKVVLHGSRQHQRKGQMH